MFVMAVTVSGLLHAIMPGMMFVSVMRMPGAVHVIVMRVVFMMVMGMPGLLRCAAVFHMVHDLGPFSDYHHGEGDYNTCIISPR
jgi:hypothetical protein